MLLRRVPTRACMQNMRHRLPARTLMSFSAPSRTLGEHAQGIRPSYMRKSTGHPINHTRPARVFFSSSGAGDGEKQKGQQSPSEPSSVAVVFDVLRRLPMMTLDVCYDITRWTLEFFMQMFTRPREFLGRMREWKKIIVDEAKHYWHGSKLLVYEVRTATGLVRRVLGGYSLTRRERKQLTRTSADILRLVPFAIFVIVPFAELALPLALKFFPNLLPSTFKTELQYEEDLKRNLKLKLDLAKFLQDTVEEMAVKVKKSNADGSESNVSAADLVDMISSARMGKRLQSNESTLKLIKLFSDEITLENISRAQLVNICKFMSLAPYGSDALLRFQIRSKIRSLKADDQQIVWEGVDTLSKEELQQACAERGMRSVGLTQYGLRRQLQQWIDLSVNSKVPITLLILSRAMTITASPEAVEQNLVDSIGELDHEVVTEVVLASAQTDRDVSKLKLQSLQFQNEMISKEAKASNSAAAAAAVVKAPAAVSVAAVTEAGATPAVKMTPGLVEAIEVLASKTALASERSELEQLKSKQLDLGLAVEIANDKARQAKEMLRDSEMMKAEAMNMQFEQLAASDAVKQAQLVKHQRMVIKIRQRLGDLRTRLRVSYTPEVKAAVPVAAPATTPTAVPAAAVSAVGDRSVDQQTMQMKSRVDSFLARIEKDMEKVESAIGVNLKKLDSDDDGVIDTRELAEVIQSMMRSHQTEEEAAALAKLLDKDGDGKISVEEIIAFARELEKREEEI